MFEIKIYFLLLSLDLKDFVLSLKYKIMPVVRVRFSQPWNHRTWRSCGQHDCLVIEMTHIQISTTTNLDRIFVAFQCCSTNWQWIKSEHSQFFTYNSNEMFANHSGIWCSTAWPTEEQINIKLSEYIQMNLKRLVLRDLHLRFWTNLVSAYNSCFITNFTDIIPSRKLIFS